MANAIIYDWVGLARRRGVLIATAGAAWGGGPENIKTDSR